VILTAREMAQVRQLELLAAKVRRGQLQGERAMRRAGPGSGFREHRAYHPGDALRRVDWHVYARMDTLAVKEFDAEEAIDLLLVQDSTASMRGRAAETAAKVCAALGIIALSQRERVQHLRMGGGPGGGAPGRGDPLDSIDSEVAGTTDLLAALKGQLPRHARGGVAFVVSDFFDPKGAAAALSRLQAHRYRVRALLMEDMQALAPPSPGRTRLVDSETGETLRVEITRETVDAYHRAREARATGLSAFCRRTGIGFLRVRAETPFFEIVRAAIARGWLSR